MATNLTPIHQLPWPDGTERVMDGDNAIGALATAVDRELEELAKPAGIIVNGPLVGGLGSASAIKLQLSTVLIGPVSWFVDASDWIQVPAGVADGMYSVELFATVGNILAASPGIYAQILYGIPAAPALIASQSVVGQGAQAVHVNVSTTVRLQPGHVVHAAAMNPVADVGDWKVERFTVRRIADVFG